MVSLTLKAILTLHALEAPLMAMARLNSPQRRLQQQVCKKTDTGFSIEDQLMAAPTKEDDTLMAAPKKDQQDGSVEMLPGMNLWEWAVSETPWPVCGEPGQNEAFQGRDLTNTAGECDKINICHGNAGFGWNRITVSRESLGNPTAAEASGHAEEEHNKMHSKRADYFPMTQSVPNPNGAGINGYLDSNCGFVCPDCPEGEQEIPGEDAPADDGTGTDGATGGTGGDDTTSGGGSTTTTTDATPTVVGETYKIGETVSDDGTTCVLQNDCTCTPPTPDGNTAEDINSNQAFSKGDPHFKTFGGEMYDYHGECDLVLLHNPDFKGGMGMDIHIRTKIEAFWSSIESAAIRLGDETLEIRADPSQEDWIWFDGEVPPGEVTEGKWRHDKVNGFLVRYFTKSTKSREAYLYLGKQEVLVFKTFKSFMRIDINWVGSDNYYNSVGLLGSHAHEGKRLGRDGKTFIENLNEFGQEWQVRPEVDGKLFHSYEGAVVDKKCVLPPTFEGGDLDAAAATLRQGRRLGASALDQDLVEKACNHVVDPQEKKACEYDVIATQDLNMASAW